MLNVACGEACFVRALGELCQQFTTQHKETRRGSSPGEFLP